VDGLCAAKSKSVGLIVRAIKFPRFPACVILNHQRHRQTDDMQSQDRALHYSVSRGKYCQREFNFELPRAFADRRG